MRTNALFSSIDFAPTICQLGECEMPEYMDGVSFANYIKNGQNPVRNCCIIEYRNGYGLSDVNSNVIITDKYKLAVYENGDMELTDLAADPEERKNVVEEKEYQQIKNKLVEKLLIEKLRNKSKGDIQYGHA